MERDGREMESAPEQEPGQEWPGPSGPASLSDAPARVLALQRSAGNAAVAALLSGQTGRAMLQRNGGGLNVLPEPVAVTWASDRFTLSFERTQEDADRFEFVLTYAGPHPFDG